MMTLLLALAMMSLAPGDLTTIAKGTLSGLDRGREVVVRTEGDWHALWKEHAPEEPPPRVDFTARTVVAVFLGSRNTAGFDVDITAVDRRDAGATVRYRERRPGAGQMVAQIITSPFHIVSVPRFDGPATFARDAR